MQSLDLVDTVTGAAFCLLLLPAANFAGSQPAERGRESLGLVHLPEQEVTQGLFTLRGSSQHCPICQMVED